MRKEVGILRDGFEVRVDGFVELFEGVVACARVGYYRSRRYLEKGLSIRVPRLRWWSRRLVAYIADVWRRTTRFGSMACSV